MVKHHFVSTSPPIRGIALAAAPNDGNDAGQTTEMDHDATWHQNAGAH
jgi:hypothetical protein